MGEGDKMEGGRDAYKEKKKDRERKQASTINVMEGKRCKTTPGHYWNKTVVGGRGCVWRLKVMQYLDKRWTECDAAARNCK